MLQLVGAAIEFRLPLYPLVAASGRFAASLSSVGTTLSRRLKLSKYTSWPAGHEVVQLATMSFAAAVTRIFVVPAGAVAMTDRGRQASTVGSLRQSTLVGVPRTVLEELRNASSK